MEYKFKLGDYLELWVGDEKREYTVVSSHLKSLSNEWVFDKLDLSIKEKYNLASDAYGYEASGGAWPTYKVGDYGAMNRLLQVLHEDYHVGINGPYKEGFASIDKHPFKVGDYVRSHSDDKYSSSHLVVQITKIVKGERCDDIYIRTTPGLSPNGYWWSNDIRYATKGEILASNFKDEYLTKSQSSALNPNTHEVQSKITTDGDRHRGEAVRSRRKSVRITSSVGLVGNQIKVVTRRSKVGKTFIQPSFLVVRRS